MTADILLVLSLVMLVGIALLGIRMFRLLEQLREAREERDSAKAEATHVRHLLARVEHDAESRARDREAEVLQDKQQANRAKEALEDSNTRLRRLVQVDELTGLANAQVMGFAMDRELRRAMRARQPVSLIVVDVDDFRGYNRACGHDKGDDLLKRIAHLAQSIFRRGGDKIGRLGGDRFAVIAPETGYDAALAQAERLRATVRGSSIPIGDPETGNRVTVSIGVSTIRPDRVVRPYQVFERAVLAVRLAKTRGGDRVRGDRPARPAGEQDRRDAEETGRTVRLYAVGPGDADGQQGRGR